MPESSHPQGAPAKRSAVIKWALIIGTAIVINLFLTYLVRVVYDVPLYEDFCKQEQVVRAIESEEACLEVGGQWNEALGKGEALEAGAYCDRDYTCRKDYDDARKTYNRNVFIVFVIAGIALLIGSVYGALGETISLSLSFGGVLALVIGSIAYWSEMNDILRLVILGAALAGLFYVAWKKFKDE